MTSVSLEWGPHGAARLGRSCDVVVVCDVLSFCTAVSVAVAHGVLVWPHAWRDGTAAARAVELGALLAGERGDEVSLSPPTLAALPPGTRVVLPSPNGAACCLAAAQAGARVVAGCLRNLSAVAAWVRATGGSIGLVPAGERWPDDALRPAYEDWLGAGLLARGLADLPRSPEALAAAEGSRARRPLTEVMSGAELVERGFAGDVAAAEEIDADDVVPVLVDGRFVRG